LERIFLLRTFTRQRDNKLAAAEATKPCATAVWLHSSKGNLQGNVDKWFIINRTHLNHIMAN